MPGRLVQDFICSRIDSQTRNHKITNSRSLTLSYAPFWSLNEKNYGYSWVFLRLLKLKDEDGSSHLGIPLFAAVVEV
ncbi:unnamed protein product [Eruca vesicaria subsp. sativa]|uniref:Uncharacterized protein n=1 Tax=Eruca vesicaria subsp. sativa TaxID=29727 RepID=A0ABC8J466_ERUVS|nr:unnamed protein product [Eruca vesicaria subsp. sativa]